MRGLASWYLKGLPKSHEYKDRLSKVRTYQELVDILDEYQEIIREYQATKPEYNSPNLAEDIE